MVKPKIISSEKIPSSIGDVEFDHYDDGELLMTTPDNRCIQFSQVSVENIKSLLKTKVVAEKLDTTDKIRIQVKEEEDGTWGANVGFDATHKDKVLRYKYKSRLAARNGKITDEIGFGGRVK